MTASVIVYGRIRIGDAVSTRQFVSMFLHGNPVSAFGAMIGVNLAGSESARISAIERLGRTKSPLNVDELRETLSDPSFNVRYEAIISIARTRPDAASIDALIAIVRSREPDLSMAAVWALGRIHATEAIPALREALDSDYPLLQARSARELANLGDAEIAPKLLAKLRTEPDQSLRVAYASALGVLLCEQAVDDLLDFLQGTQAQSLRDETTLALARIVGGERRFMRLWRRARSDLSTSASQAALALQKQLGKLDRAGPDCRQIADACADALASNDLPEGARLLGEVVAAVPIHNFRRPATAILGRCRQQLRQFDPSHREVLLLVLHALREELDRMHRDQRHGK